MRARREDEGGFVVIWLLFMAIFVVVGVFLTTDAWRIIAVDRDLSAAVDGAAAAGANGLDEQTYRDTGVVQLDPDRAEALAADNLGDQPHGAEMVNVSIDATATEVRVTAERDVDLLLLRFIGGSGRTVRAGATATPRRGT